MKVAQLSKPYNFGFGKKFLGAIFLELWSLSIYGYFEMLIFPCINHDEKYMHRYTDVGMFKCKGA